MKMDVDITSVLRMRFVTNNTCIKAADEITTLRTKVEELTQERDDLKIGLRHRERMLDSYQEDLAASQAREQQFREALEKYYFDFKLAKELLASPSGTTALDRSNKLYAAGVLRELCKFAATHQCNFDLWLLDKAEQLRKEAGE
jgi:hypothetical protein